MFKTVKIRDGHDNFFTPLRLIFALMVVVGHCYAVVFGGPTGEPHIFYHYTFSYLAVNLFFIASGFLVTKSMLYRGDVIEFGAARFLRIYPGLLVHVLFVMLIVGVLATSMPLMEYFTHRDFLKQPFVVLSFIETEMYLPQVFETNAEQLSSAPLWTLRYEILAYIGTAILFAIGFMRKRWMILAQFVLPAIAYLAIFGTAFYDELPATIQALMRFSLPYGLGAVLYAYRDRLSFHILGVPLMIGLACLTSSLTSQEIFMNFALGYFVIWAAFVKIPKLNSLQNLSDISYGIYIYHWCIMQLLFMWMPKLGVAMLFALTLPLTILLASASWHIIEKPMLKRKKGLADALRFGRKKRNYDPKAVLLD